MPPTKSSVATGLKAKLGAKLKDAVKTHANDETTFGFINLPAGIPQGVAQLQKCYFDVYKTGENKGQYYFRAMGVVITPKIVDNQYTQGPMVVRNLTTSQMIPCCDTKNGKGEITPMAEHIAKVLNIMRQLGGDDYTADASEDNLEVLAKGLEEAAPFFKFSTTPRTAQQDGQGGVKKGDVTGTWENWHGTEGLEDFVPPEAERFKEESPAVGGKNPTHSTRAPQGKTTPPTNGKQTAPPADEPPPFTPENCGIDQIDDLLADAESDSDTSGPSQERLEAMGIEAGMTEDEVKKVNTWSSLVERIKELVSGDGGGAELAPEEGGEYGYRPVDPRTKKPVKTAIKAEVIKGSVNEEKRTVSLKSGRAVYKDISWDALEAPPE